MPGLMRSPVGFGRTEEIEGLVQQDTRPLNGVLTNPMEMVSMSDMLTGGMGQSCGMIVHAAAIRAISVRKVSYIKLLNLA